MANAFKKTVPLDVKEQVVDNLQQSFPLITDRNIIFRVLSNENWDLERTCNILMKLHNEFSKKQNKNKNALPKTDNVQRSPQPRPTEISGNPVEAKTKKTIIKPVDLKQNQEKQRKQQNVQTKNKAKADLKKTYEYMKQLKDPFDRIIGYCKSNIKVLIFMRGCPGSGKSTYAKELLSLIGVYDTKFYIFSADDFFIDDLTGAYSYNPDFIGSAHEWNQKLVKQAVTEGRSPIIIDNTHTRLWEMKENAAVGVEHGYVIETLEPKTPWFFVESQLVKKTTHNVSRESIQRMIDRYEPNLSGIDIINLARLTYKRPPPSRTSIELNVPPSKKTITLYNNKNTIKDGNPTLVYSNKKYQPNEQGNQQSSIKKQMFSPLSKAMPSPFLSQNATKFNWPFVNDQSQKSSNVTSYFENPVHNFQLKNQNTNNVKSFQNDSDNVPTSFDLINLNEVVQPNHMASTSYDNTSIQIADSSFVPETNIPYMKYCENFKEDSTSSAEEIDDEPSDSDDEIVDDLNETSEDSEEDEVKNSRNSSFVSVEMGALSTNKKENNSCVEYILIKSDQTILYQKEHENAPTDLNDFKNLYKENDIASNIIHSAANNAKSNYEYTLLKQDETLINQIHEEVSENLRGLQSSFKNEVDDMFNSGGIQENIESSVKYEQLKAESEVTVCSKGTSTACLKPAEILNEQIKINEMVKEASSNTNHIDFKLLRQVNIIDGDIDNIYRDFVKIGKPIFESGPFINNNTKHVPSVLMLDKSSMTSEIETNQIKNTEVCIESLVQMFPTIRKENLEELFNTCEQNLDWTVGLLLDSGHEMSEFCVLNFNNIKPNIDTTEKVVEHEIEENNNLNASSSDSNKSNKDAVEKKKKKKNNLLLTDSSLDLIQNFQEKFILNDDYYSEKLSKIRKQKMYNNNEETQQKGNLGEFEYLEQLEEPNELVDEDEEEDNESDVGLVLDKNMVIQLQNKFGGLLSSNLIGDKTIIHIPKSLARQLYSYAFDSVREHLEEQQALIDMLIDEDRTHEVEQAPLLQRQPSFQEIMDHEIAIRMSQAQDKSNRVNTVASTLSRALLMERFPNFDPTTLTSILEDTNHSLHEATNLLTLAGHPITEGSQESSSSKKADETNPLSREEAIEQAHAYSDVAGKLYDMREDCLKKAERALGEGNKTVAKYYSEMAKWYMERIEQSNSLAASAMLNGYENATTLDLHFLQVQQALKVLDLFLDEKVRGLKNRKSVAYIITGRGSHSPNGYCRIKQAVQIRLHKRRISFTEQNPGMLKVIITKRAVISYKKNVMH